MYLDRIEAMTDSNSNGKKNQDHIDIGYVEFGDDLRVVDGEIDYGGYVEFYHDNDLEEEITKEKEKLENKEEFEKAIGIDLELKYIDASMDKIRKNKSNLFTVLEDVISQGLSETEKQEEIKCTEEKAKKLELERKRIKKRKEMLKNELAKEKNKYDKAGLLNEMESALNGVDEVFESKKEQVEKKKQGRFKDGAFIDGDVEIFNGAYFLPSDKK